MRQDKRRDLADTAEAYKTDTAEAVEWIDKTLATKKIKAARAPGSGGILCARDLPGNQISGPGLHHAL